MVELPFRAPLQFEPLCFAEARSEGHWFVFCGDRLLVELGPPERPSDDPRFRARPAFARLPASGALRKNHTEHNIWGSEPARTLYLGRLGGVDCWTAELPANAAAPAGLSWEGLRPLFSVLDDDHFALAGRALQLLEWDRNHQFCGRCGTPTLAKREERVRVCPACKLSAYPRVAPAVMALVHRGKQLLLARSPHFPAGMFSALAG
ncbi:MAG TPA: NUDIX-like domain-containing protein, partial [Burkholderiales bacterium]|nr:NUDIX-like domain-containing protein [Burkholderiales bacterium]